MSAPYKSFHRVRDDRHGRDIGERSDAVLRTACPGHDSLETARELLRPLHHLPRPSHIAVPALDGLADYRCRDLIGDLDVPNFAFALRCEVGEQLWDDRHIAYLVAAQAEAAGDVFQRGPAEHRQAVVDAVGAQLVKLRAVAAVVHRADQDAISLTLERLEFLDMEQQPAVAF